MLGLVPGAMATPRSIGPVGETFHRSPLLPCQANWAAAFPLGAAAGLVPAAMATPRSWAGAPPGLLATHRSPLLPRTATSKPKPATLITLGLVPGAMVTPRLPVPYRFPEPDRVPVL